MIHADSSLSANWSTFFSEDEMTLIFFQLDHANLRHELGET